MRRFHRVRRCEAEDVKLLLQAIMLLAGVRIALSILPFRYFIPFTKRLAARGLKSNCTDRRTIDGAAWAVARVSPWIPKASCLTQAVATQVMLSWRGVPAKLHIGVTRNDDAKFAAHAWVTTGDRVVVGGTVENFTPLVVLESGCRL